MNGISCRYAMLRQDTAQPVTHNGKKKLVYGKKIDAEEPSMVGDIYGKNG